MNLFKKNFMKRMAFAKLGKINGVTQEELKQILGEGDVTVTLSLN
jgi:hypothetical protein